MPSTDSKPVSPLSRTELILAVVVLSLIIVLLIGMIAKRSDEKGETPGEQRPKGSIIVNIYRGNQVIIHGGGGIDHGRGGVGGVGTGGKGASYNYCGAGAGGYGGAGYGGDGGDGGVVVNVCGKGQFIIHSGGGVDHSRGGVDGVGTSGYAGKGGSYNYCSTDDNSSSFIGNDVDVGNSGLGSSPSSSPGCKYDVYLNFRDMDSLGLVYPLHIALLDAGISVFQDISELPLGEAIEMHSMDAIMRSRILIPILSIDHASSVRCLNELVLMWECREANGGAIIPIFYGISPSDVRHLTGDFGVAFGRHETEGVDSKTIQTWKKVLQEIVELRGYSANLYKGYKAAELVKDVVLHVTRWLKDDDGLHPKDGQAPGDDPAFAVDAPAPDEENLRESTMPAVEGQSFMVASEELVMRKSPKVPAGVPPPPPEDTEEPK